MALVTSEPAAAGSSPAVTPVSDLAVQLAHVRRGFGEKPALVDLSISAPTGTITVLLGPNGAGKTTAVRMITGALSPESGSVRVFGLDPRVDGEEVRRRCGVVSAKPALYDRLNGRDNLAYSADAVPGRATPASPAAAERFGIVGRARSTGGRLLDRHEDAPRARPVGPPRSRAAPLRRTDVGPRPRVVGRGARADPRDGRRGTHRRHVHPPPPRSRRPRRSGGRARERDTT